MTIRSSAMWTLAVAGDGLRLPPLAAGLTAEQ
jgi:hypothetical protein